MDMETELGTEFDAASQGLPQLDDGEPEVSLEVEGQKEGESQTEIPEGDGLDLESPQFAYTDEDGNEIQLTGQQIIDLLESQKQAAAPEVKEEEPPKVETKPEEAAAELPFQIDPIDYKRVGTDLTAMLSGELGGEEALGPAMAEFQFQNILQDPRYAQVFSSYIEAVIDKRNKESKEVESFQSFVGTKAEETQIKDFQKSNPWAKTKEMALLGIQLANAKAENEKLKTGTTEAVKKAEQEGKIAGEKQTIRNLKAKGTLRAIGQKGVYQSPKTDDLTKKYDIHDPDQRTMAMAERIKQMRGQT